MENLPDGRPAGEQLEKNAPRRQGLSHAGMREVVAAA
jgi:hypothetical protein